MLDLDQTVFSRSDLIIEENIDKESSSSENLTNRESVLKKEENQNIIKLISDKTEEAIVLEIEENNNFFVKTLGDVKVNNEIIGYIMVTEQANEILVAVDERKNFSLRTVLIITIVIIQIKIGFD